MPDQDIETTATVIAMALCVDVPWGKGYDLAERDYMNNARGVIEALRKAGFKIVKDEAEEKPSVDAG